MTEARRSPAPGGADPYTSSVLAQIAALRMASTPDLKQQWRVLFGAEPPLFSRPIFKIGSVTVFKNWPLAG